MPPTESVEAQSAYVLALSGSLRRHSIHTLLLQYLAEQSGGEVALFPVEKLGALKPFNPDLEENGELKPQPELQELRTALLNSQGVIIACPEYAHGIPGHFKNTLDWLVGSGEFIDKPVGIVIASATSKHAPAQLLEVFIGSIAYHECKPRN